MDMPKNHFKQRLRQRQWQVGLFVGLASGYSMEIIAGAGFDWLVIDAGDSPDNRASVLPRLFQLQPDLVAAQEPWRPWRIVARPERLALPG